MEYVTRKQVVRSLLLVAGGGAALGAAGQFAAGLTAMGKLALAMPLVVLGGAALALPPLFLLAPHHGDEYPRDLLVGDTLQALRTTGYLILGWAIPTAYFSATLPPAQSHFLLFASFAFACAWGVSRLARLTFGRKLTGASFMRGVVWSLLAGAVGVRMLGTLTDNALLGISPPAISNRESFIAMTQHIEPAPIHAPAPPAEDQDARASSPSLLVPSGKPQAPPPPWFQVVETLLRHPASFESRLEHIPQQKRVQLIVAVAAASASLFGIAVGAHRGSYQILFCAIKYPLLLLGTFMLCLPAFMGVAKAAKLPMTNQDMLTMTVGALGRFSLIHAALAPLIWVLESPLRHHYHTMILVICCVGGLAGLGGASLLMQNLRGSHSKRFVSGITMIGIFALVGGHTGWLLRPYVVRPKTVSIPILRPLGSDLFSAVGTSLRSALLYSETDLSDREVRRREEGRKSHKVEWIGRRPASESGSGL